MISLGSLQTHSLLANWDIIYCHKNFKFKDSMAISYFSFFLFKIPSIVNFPEISYTKQIFIKHLNKQMNKLQLHGPTKSWMETISSLQVPIWACQVQSVGQSWFLAILFFFLNEHIKWHDTQNKTKCDSISTRNALQYNFQTREQGSTEWRWNKQTEAEPVRAE